MRNTESEETGAAGGAGGDEGATKGGDEAARAVVLESLQDLRPLLPPDVQVEVGPDSPLAGPDGPLDSLGIVNLVVAVENRARQHLGTDVGLTAALGLTAEESPFRTVRTLTDWVARAGRSHS